MDEIPGWILRAIAGNGHDVDWSRMQYGIFRGVSSLYPLEVHEDLTAEGHVTFGSFVRGHMDTYTTGVVLYDARLWEAYLELPPEDFYTTNVVIYDATLYESYFVQEPERYDTQGSVYDVIITDYVFTPNTESFTALGYCTGGSFA